MNNAISTLNWFINGHIDHRIKTFSGLSNRYVKHTPTITVEEFLEYANNSLDALHLSMHPSKKHCKDFSKDWTDQKDWASLRLIGPYIPLSREASRHDTIELFGELPYQGVLGICQTDIEELKEGEEEKKQIYDFITFCRMDTMPPGWVPTGPGYPYSVNFVVVYRGGPVKIQWLCTIDNKGNVHPPLHIKKGYHVIKSKDGSLSVPVKHNAIYDPVKELTVMEEGRKNTTSYEMLAWAINAQQRIDTNVTVRATDKRGTVNLSISMEEAKLLFNKRIKVKTNTGRTRPIIHWVTSHTRVTGANVRTHWRGLNEFVWMGMNIKISIPGVHAPLCHDTTALEPSGAGWLHKLLSIKTKEYTLPGSKEKITVEVVGKKESGLLRSHYYTNKPLLH